MRAGSGSSPTHSIGRRSWESARSRSKKAIKGNRNSMPPPGLPTRWGGERGQIPPGLPTPRGGEWGQTSELRSMQRVLRVALAQVNPIVGDLDGNTRLITDRIKEARDKGADVVCFPELALTGYPPEDLVLKPGFVRDNLRQLESVVAATAGISAVGGVFEGTRESFYSPALLPAKKLEDADNTRF